MAEGEKEQNLELHFSPEPATNMVVACLWSRWEQAGEAPLESMAAITDEPPPEIAQTGHDRCVIILNAARADDWLVPEGKSDIALDDIMNDRPTLLHRYAVAA